MICTYCIARQGHAGRRGSAGVHDNSLDRLMIMISYIIIVYIYMIVYIIHIYIYIYAIIIDIIYVHDTTLDNY